MKDFEILQFEVGLKGILSMGKTFRINARNNAKVEKTGKLISLLVYFFTAIVNVSFLEGRLGTGLCPYPVLRFSSDFLISQDPLGL